MPELEPVDPERCQCLIQGGSFMTFGPRPVERCKRKPYYIVTETKPAEDGLKGSMSLCKKCYEKFTERFPADFATKVTVKRWIKENSNLSIPT